MSVLKLSVMSRVSRVADFQEQAGGGAVRCLLCPRFCVIGENTAGFCGARKCVGERVGERSGECVGERAVGSREGSLIAAGYGLVSSLALDPIEKKPLRMFRSGAKILSVGGFGCNLRCGFCQNHDISMIRVSEATRSSCAACDASDTFSHPEPVGQSRYMPPGEILSLAAQTVSKGNIGVAYTYNEPFINFEYLLDCARLVHDAGLSNVVVSNGYINKEPLEMILPYIDAMNIDLKGFTNGFYEKVAGKLDPVMETIAASFSRCHVEVTTLVIPGENENDIPEIAAWLSSLNPDIPLHLSRFFPRYLYSDRLETSRDTIFKLRDAAGKYLNNVFTGNM